MYQIDFKNPKWVHFIGIGGISMSGLAELLFSRGFKISGSDAQSSELTERMEKDGIHVCIGQKAENIQPGMDVVVYTAAIHPDNEEFKAAAERKIPMLSRAQLLGQIMNNFTRSVAVAGTHGKTTTTSMLTEILLAADADPTVSVGGMLDSIGGNLRIGHSPNFVAEACEYTNSFLEFHPYAGIILNIREDHLDFFKDLADIRHSFHLFAENIAENGMLILDGSIEHPEELTEGLKCRVVTVGMEEGCDYQAVDCRFEQGACEAFTLLHKGEIVGEISLKVPGAHNVRNSLAAIAAAMENGIPFAAVQTGLESFHGTHRRFEKKGELADDILVIDDYAHHPDEIRATLAAARRYGRRVVCIFQPHTYTRTKALFKDFVKVLAMADEVILAEIYPARETDTLGMSSRLLAEELQSEGVNARYFSTFADIEEYLKKNSVHGDMLITMGAGDVVKIGENLIQG